MKKSILVIVTVILGITACKQKEIIESKQIISEKLTNDEQIVIDKLIKLGISSGIANQLIMQVVRPQRTLINTYNSEIAIENAGLFKNGVYHLIDGPGPGESGGPIADKCAKPGNKCKVTGAVHNMTQLEMDTFFPGGYAEFYAIVGPDGAYLQEHPYVQYLSIIFND